MALYSERNLSVLPGNTDSVILLSRSFQCPWPGTDLELHWFVGAGDLGSWTLKTT